MKLLLTSALVLALSSVFAATGGAPTAAGPGPVPKFSLIAVNDDGTTDDHRTNEINVVFKAYGGVVSLSHSMLTDYDGGTRTDELTAMYGIENKWGNIWSISAVGGRYTGDGLGQPIQNTFHKATDTKSYVFNLRTEHLGPAAVLSQEFGYLRLIDEGGFAWKARVVAASDLIVDGEATAHVIMKFGNALLFVGCKGVLNHCPESNNDLTRKFVRDFEKGVYADFSFQWGFLDCGISIKPENGDGVGYLAIRKRF